MFHVANFPQYRGAQVLGRTGAVFQGRVELTGGGWRILLDSRETSSVIVDGLRKSGGYAITHVGELSRSAGDPFDAGSGLLVLDAFGELLSFAVAARSRPFLHIGYDLGGHAVWRTWEPPAATTWASRLYWFNADDPTCLDATFRALLVRWSDPHQQEVFRRVVYLLTEANRRGVEPALIVAQAALEVLAWQVLVNEKKTLSREGFDTLPAADMLRLLLTTSGIPLDIPVELAGLTAYAKAKSTADGPQTLTLIRNSWVHPPKRVFTPAGPEVGDAWLLSLWYVDLVTLRWLGYFGEYASRVRNLAVERVPWA